MLQDGGYRKLFSALRAQGRPSRGLLQALLAMSSAPTGDQLNVSEFKLSGLDGTMKKLI
jgi:hypothetical protein